MDAKNLGAFLHVTAGSFKRLHDYVPLDLFQRQRLRHKHAVSGDRRLLEFIRKVGNGQFITLAKQHGALNDALQLAYISGPFIMRQSHNGVLRDVPDVLVILFVVALQ